MLWEEFLKVLTLLKSGQRLVIARENKKWKGLVLEKGEVIGEMKIPRKLKIEDGTMTAYLRVHVLTHHPDLAVKQVIGATYEIHRRRIKKKK